MNSLLINALHCKNKDRAPVWLMRQAGRYMPEYRSLRQKYSFLEMCHQPELIAEVTQLPIKAFGFDAAILFSDILVIPEALNMGLHFDEGQGPVIERPLENESGIPHLSLKGMPDRLSYVAEGIRLLLPELKVPLIGFSGAPFTLASYMIEGKTSRDLHKTKLWMFREPESFHRLLSILTECICAYLDLQITAGIHAVQIFDSWANVLAHSQFSEFSQAYLAKIVQHVKSRVPIILFCRGSSVFAPELAKANPNAISVDWNVNLSKLRPLISSSIAIQGNLDPDILYAPLNTVRHEVKGLLKSMHADPGYIFNLGHGITPGTPVDAVKTLVDCVKEYN